jgi:WD40 repeat protein
MFKGYLDLVYLVAFLPDGIQVVLGSDDIIIWLWDAVTGAPLQMFKGYLSRVYLVAFSPDGIQIVSSLYNIIVRLWDVATGALL